MASRLGILLANLAVAFPAFGAPVLHEKVPPELLRVPSVSGTAAAADSVDRRLAAAIDRATGEEPPGPRVYHTVFNPAEFPFKRISAFDTVRPDETLAVFDPATAPVPRAMAGGERDLFTGTLTIEIGAQGIAGLPSVAAESRLHWIESEPAAALAVERDAAENWSVRGAPGRYRLRWLVDAPAKYFGGELPRDVTIGDVPAGMLHRLPPPVQLRAEAVLKRIGIAAQRDEPFLQTLDALVAYFRAFEPGNPVTPSESVYVDLVLGKRGSCRHRSYAFMVTALGAGIPTRYVENEIHVFVEVWLPRFGWRRINLGGATVPEQIVGADDKVPYRPRGGNPFSRPETYAKTTTDADKAWNKAVEKSGAPVAAARDGGTGGAAATKKETPPMIDLRALDRQAAKKETMRQARTTLRVDPLEVKDAVRGELVVVHGAVGAEGGDVAGLGVEIYLEGSRGAVFLGKSESDADGHFEGRFAVPSHLRPGDYHVVARTPGDERRGPSTTR